MPLAPTPRNLAELCSARALTHADRLAVDDGSLRLTYAELWARVRGAAAQLRTRGVGPGDRVLLVARNSSGWVIAAFGVLTAGAELVPLGHGASPADKRRAAERLAPVLLIADDEAWTDADPVLERISIEQIAALAPDGDAPDSNVPDSEAVPVPAESTAVVMSTSGTTGAVKYIPMTHAQLCRLYGGMSGELGLVADDLLLGTVPLAHSFGFNGVLLVALWAGAGVRLVGQYQPDCFPELLAEGLTVLAGPPTIYHDLEVAGVDAGGVRLAITGSTEVQAARMRAICDALGVPELVVGYGMTETCGSVAIGRVGADPGVLPWLTPLDGVEIRVVDSLGAAPAAGVAGRLLVRGYNVQHGYADSLEQTVDRDGWLDTGDLAILDDEGRIGIVSRAKDTVIVSGFNVVPQDVEQALMTHPDVARAVVVGLPDARQGERLVGCIVAGSETPTPESLSAHLRAQLAAFKVPGEYRFITDLPVTSTGKVSRAEIRRQLMVAED